MNEITGSGGRISEAHPSITTGFESHKKISALRHYRLRRLQDGTAKVAQKDSRLYTTGYDSANFIEGKYTGCVTTGYDTGSYRHFREPDTKI